MPLSGVPTVSPESLERRIAAREPLLLLDTRDPATSASFPFDSPRPVELANLPYDRLVRDVDAGLASLPAPGTAGPIVCFCYRGDTAVEVVRALRAAGYQAENLEGGMLRWSELVVPTVVPGSGALGAEAALLQLRRLGKGCLGYALVAADAALLVDVGRNLEAALAAVAERGAKVVRVADTHLHADHLSGGPQVARETGAPYALPAADATDVRHAYEPVGDGDIWRVGDVEVRAIHTPGHTDGSTSYLVGGRFLLTGDTLFVTGLGRPDLSGQGERLARVLHRTLIMTIPALGEEVEILPAHISSAAEVGAAGVASARLGDLKRTTLSGLSPDADVFSRSLLAALPEQPPNFDRIRAANRGAPTPEPSELEYGPNRCAVTGGGAG